MYGHIDKVGEVIQEVQEKTEVWYDRWKLEALELCGEFARTERNSVTRETALLTSLCTTAVVLA